MSYKALYRTYRPKTFNEVIGQDHITSTLMNIISNDKIGHAYLFSGPRGTGKTSVAHVFARAVNANAAGVETFDEMDIIEIDAASNNGVAEVRTLIDNVNYAPSKAKYKVYIIDEVHMLTKGAFNALLKTLEEPPAHVIFILATTEPHKIPVTILSRTQRFNFRRIDDTIISRQLKTILEKEDIQFDDEAIMFISKLAQGGMRDALSIADQASAFGGGKLSFEAISQVFGIISISNQIKLFNHSFNGESKELMKLITKILKNGADVERLSSSLVDILKDKIIYLKTSDESLLSFITKEEVEKMDMDIYYSYKAVDIMMDLLTDLVRSPAPRQAFELAMLKLINNENATTVKEKTKETNIFTKEILKTAPNDSTTILEKEEINLDVVNEEQEQEAQLNSVEDEILSTQEIDLSGDKLIKSEKSLSSTDDLDLMKLFNAEPIVKDEDTKSNKNLSEIINLLVQADREEIMNVKSRWATLSQYENNDMFRNFAQLLKQTRPISAGKNFILIASENEHVIEGVNLDSKNEHFNLFINELLGVPTRVFAITKEEFDIVKEEWANLTKADELPKPKPIKQPKIANVNKTEEQQLGEELFGDLFSS